MCYISFNLFAKIITIYSCVFSDKVDYFVPLHALLRIPCDLTGLKKVFGLSYRVQGKMYEWDMNTNTNFISASFEQIGNKENVLKVLHSAVHCSRWLKMERVSEASLLAFNL